MSENAFIPGSTVTLSATQATASVAVPGGTKSRRRIRVRIPAGDDTVFLAFGGSGVTAALTDMPMHAGTTEYFTLLEGQTHVAAICASTETATVYITEGSVG